MLAGPAAVRLTALVAIQSDKVHITVVDAAGQIMSSGAISTAPTASTRSPR